jgi:hypothetical protein
MNKETEIDGFLKTLFSNNANRVACDEGAAELFGKSSPFRVMCQCGSTAITINGESGIDYGGETGYQPGSTVLKCRDCGAALTVHHS